MLHLISRGMTPSLPRSIFWMSFRSFQSYTLRWVPQFPASTSAKSRPPKNDLDKCRLISLISFLDVEVNSVRIRPRKDNYSNHFISLKLYQNCRKVGIFKKNNKYFFSLLKYILRYQNFKSVLSDEIWILKSGSVLNKKKHKNQTFLKLLDKIISIRLTLI